MSIEATYDSECAGCFGTIFEGEEIATADGEWMHLKCAEEAWEDGASRD